MSRPFDEAHYRGLLEGLEVAEIPWSSLERTKRLDAEFFHPRHLRIAEILAAHATQPITEVAAVSDGNHFAVSEEFVEEGIPYYRGQDAVGHFFIEQSAPNYISEKAFRQPYMTRSHLKRGDVLLSIIGTIGEAGLVADESPATCSCKLAILRPRDVVPEYLAVFLRSIYGRSQVERFTRGAVQMGLLLEDMDQIRVARQAPEFESLIASIVACAKRTQEAAVKATEQAEQTLLRALGLENWQPPEPLTYTRPSHDAFAAGRLDAEYFAPRVAELLDRLKRDGLTLGGVAPVRHERFTPGAAAFLPSPSGGGAGGEGTALNQALSVDRAPFPPPSPPPEGEGTKPSDAFEYIEIGGVRADGTAVSESVPNAEAPSRATWLVKAGDVVTSTVRPIRRLSALIAPEQDGHVCSSGFVVLQPVAVPAEVLLTYLRLPPVCELLDLHTSASLYPAISEQDLLAFPIPRIDEAAQAQVVASVQTAQSNRRRAAELLAAARCAVEIAIEENEAAALAYLGGAMPSGAAS